MTEPPQTSNMTNSTSDPHGQYKLVASSTVAVLGAILNSLSLSYYVITLRHSKKGLSRLVMLLNIFDLAVCLSAALVQVFFQSLKIKGAPVGTIEILLHVSLTIYRIATLTTGIMTCILSSTRALSLYRPFYHPNIHLVLKVLTTLGVGMTVPNVTILVIHKAVPHLQVKMGMLSSLALKIETTAILATVIFVAGINVLTVLKMSSKVRYKSISKCGRKEKDSDFIHATMTVAILSGIFCLLNLFYLALVFGPCVTTSLPKTTCHPKTFLQWYGMWQALPINSTLNPLVYFARSESMRRYLKFRLATWFPCCVTDAFVAASFSDGFTSNDMQGFPNGASQYRLTAQLSGSSLTQFNRRRVLLPTRTVTSSISLSRSSATCSEVKSERV